mmetsp:Transcript_17133/g.48700  ORF Transcript_17133/g.48700 Transcript_17133/m.48700 type:complete len:295 (-) Transcript_17133:1118-2002(-)
MPKMTTTPLAWSRARRVFTQTRRMAHTTSTASFTWTSGVAKSSGNGRSQTARATGRRASARKTAACGRARACRLAIASALRTLARKSTSACGRTSAWRLATPSTPRRRASQPTSAYGRTTSARRVAGPSARIPVPSRSIPAAFGQARSARTTVGHTIPRMRAASMTGACGGRASAIPRAALSPRSSRARASSVASGTRRRNMEMPFACRTLAPPLAKTAPIANVAARSVALPASLATPRTRRTRHACRNAPATTRRIGSARRWATGPSSSPAAHGRASLARRTSCAATSASIAW